MTGWPRGAGIALLCCTTFASCSGAAFADDRRVAEGSALFSGSAPIVARLAGDTDVLPAIASRCVNCHERSTKSIAGLDATPATVATTTRSVGEGATSSTRTAPPSAGGGTYASALDAAWLTTPRVRHGGPAVRYDEVSFCTLVRTGVDPAQIVIPPVMPRYDATDAQCASLWAFLGSR